MFIPFIIQLLGFLDGNTIGSGDVDMLQKRPCCSTTPTTFFNSVANGSTVLEDAPPHLVQWMQQDATQ